MLKDGTLRVINLMPGDVFTMPEGGPRMRFVSVRPVGVGSRSRVTVTDEDGSNRRTFEANRFTAVQVITPRRD